MQFVDCHFFFIAGYFLVS